MCNLLGEEFSPKSGANNAFTTKQRLCIALRYYATGTFQYQIGDSECASQASCHRIIKKVLQVLASHVTDVVQFSTDPDVFQSVSEGFYAFKGSELLYQTCHIICNLLRSVLVIEIKNFKHVYLFLFVEFPNFVGTIDGTQIPIQHLWVNLEQYFDHHKRHSISVLAVVNHCGAVTYLSV